MMDIRKEPEQLHGQSENAGPSFHTPVGAIIKEVILTLRGGHPEKAADLFVGAQKKGVLPDNRNFVKKLFDILGENNANQLISAFAFHPCQVCTKGRTKCESCNGRGHIEHYAICERCFGLGIARCSFCNGSGWLALSDIPEGIRAPALIQRVKKILDGAKAVLDRPIPQPSKDNPASSLKKCATLWVVMDNFMGVLENIVAISQTSMIPSLDSDRPLRDAIQSAVPVAINLKQQVRKVVTALQESAQMKAQITPSDSVQAKLAGNRADFYKELLDKSDIIVNLSDSHPLLEKAIKNQLHGKPPNNPHSQRQ